MFWVALFIVGVFVVLAGAIPLILNGVRGRHAATLALGALLIAAGAAGVFAKPDLVALRLPRVVFGGPSPEPAAEAPVVKSTDSLPAPDEPKEAEAPVVATRDVTPGPAKLPEPVPVTTTKIVGGETDAMASQSTPLPDNGSEPMPMPVPAPEPAKPDEAAILAALAPNQTREEAAFTTAVTAARQEYENASGDDRAALQSSRAAAICAAVKDPAVKNWVGRIKEIDKDAGGRTIVSVSLPDGTLVKTWNNAMSDVEDKTLIIAGTPLAAAFSQLAEGDTIRFSGTFFSDEPDCYRSSRLSLDQSMLEPSFLFRFNEVEKI